MHLRAAICSSRYMCNCTVVIFLRKHYTQARMWVKSCGTDRHMQTSQTCGVSSWTMFFKGGWKLIFVNTYCFPSITSIIIIIYKLLIPCLCEAKSIFILHHVYEEKMHIGCTKQKQIIFLGEGRANLDWCQIMKTKNSQVLLSPLLLGRIPQTGLFASIFNSYHDPIPMQSLEADLFLPIAWMTKCLVTALTMTNTEVFIRKSCPKNKKQGVEMICGIHV